MNRDLPAELDDLRAAVDELSRQIQTLLAATHVPSTSQREQPDPADGEVGAHPANSADAPTSPHTRRATDDALVLRQTAPLVAEAQARGLSGLLSYLGVYIASDTYGRRESRWVTEERAAEELLAQDDSQVARVLAALGNRQRLAILKAILQQPASVAELVMQLGLGTTGQAYHHLKALQAADLVEQEERGRFVIKPHRVQSILLLLAGVYDMLDGRHSSGSWSDDAEPQLPARSSSSTT